MQRYKFLLSSSVVVLAVWSLWVSVALADASMPHYRVAVFTAGATESLALEGLQEGLARLGYVNGKNITLMVEDTHGVVPDLVQRAARLVAANPDVLVTVGPVHTTAARQVTDRVPLVFTYGGYPLRAGLIASAALSPHNVPGVSAYSGTLLGKRIELLQEVAPGIKRLLAVVTAPERSTERSFQVLAETAQQLGIQVLRRDVTTREEIEHVFRDTPVRAGDALYYIPSALMAGYVDLLAQKAHQEKLPLMVHEDSLVDQSGLFSYGTSVRLLGMQTADLVARVLREAHPTTLPRQTPHNLILAINLTTAKAIGLAPPRSVFARVASRVE